MCLLKLFTAELSMLFSTDAIVTLCPTRYRLKNRYTGEGKFRAILYSFLKLLYNRKCNYEDYSMDKDLVRHLFDYNEESGILYWKNPTNSIAPGSVAGTPSPRDKYITVVVNKKRYMVHRIIWLWMTGDWPKHQIDHINHNRADNRWVNLRDVTHRQNHMNRPMSKANKSGHVGVRWDKSRNKWKASIKLEDRKLHLGRFDTKEEAIEARKEAERVHGYHENSGVKYDI